MILSAKLILIYLFVIAPLFAAWGYFLNFIAKCLVNNQKNKYSEILETHFSKKTKSLFNLITIILSVIIFVSSCYLLSFDKFVTGLIFISALLIIIRTDLEFMLISEATTLFLIPIGFLFSYLNATWITLPMAIAGSIAGYAILWFINKIFYLLRKKDGLGTGDMDLLAMVGAFTGLLGVWLSILIGSITASIVGIILVCIKREYQIKIPFGPFLAIGAILSFLFNNQLLKYLLT